MIKSERIFIARFLVWVFLVNAFWPTLIASAAEKNASLLLVCSSHGYQYIWVDEDGSAPDEDNRAASPCPYCVVQSDDVWSPDVIAAVISIGSLAERVVLERGDEFFTSSILQRYSSRAPPHVSFG